MGDGTVLFGSLFRHPTYHVCDFNFCGHVKTLVYDTPVDNAEKLFARVSVVAGKILRQALSIAKC